MTNINDSRKSIMEAYEAERAKPNYNVELNGFQYGWKAAQQHFLKMLESEEIAQAIHGADDLGKCIHWGCMSGIGVKQRKHYYRLAQAALATIKQKLMEE